MFKFLGRVHSAIVSGLNYDSRTVTVEWFEKGETKGKEVCLRNIQLKLGLLIFIIQFMQLNFNFNVYSLLLIT